MIFVDSSAALIPRIKTEMGSLTVFASSIVESTSTSIF